MIANPLAWRQCRRATGDGRRRPSNRSRPHSRAQGGSLLIASAGFGAMRAHLLTTAAAAALLGGMPAHAQDATWLPNPGSNNFNTASNWTPATVPTGTAFFGTSNTTSIAFQSFTTTSVGTLQFNPGAPAYSFTTENGSPHQSVSPVPASLTVLPTHRLLSSATRRTFFSQCEYRWQRHHNHQHRWSNRICRQRHRRRCTLHHQRRRRIRHHLPVVWRDDGRLDRGCGDFLSGLKPAHRR